MDSVYPLYNNRRYVDAINLCNEILKTHVYLRFEAYVAMAACLNQLGRYSDALTVCGFAEKVYDGKSRPQTIWNLSYLQYIRSIAAKKLGGQGGGRL